MLKECNFDRDVTRGVYTEKCVGFYRKRMKTMIGYKVEEEKSECGEMFFFFEQSVVKC